MTVNQVTQGLGSWSLRLREDTPREVLDALEYFGHIAVMPGRVKPYEYGDNLLSAARYVGVFLGRSANNQFELSGQGMAWWLGDGDDKGYVFESAVNLNAVGFGTAVSALLPPAVTVGTLHSVPGLYTGVHKWETPRKAIGYVCDVLGAEFRVNGNATLDAGLVPDLYRTTPQVLLVSKNAGRELARRAVAGQMALDSDTEDYATRVVVLAAGEGESIATGTADVPSTPYRDMHGNDIIITRLVSSAQTVPTNAPAVAQLQLNRFVNPRQNAKLSSQDYYVAGDLEVGDYISVFDPTNGYFDNGNEAYWQGQPINPVNLRCVEMSWPVEAGWTVAFRTNTGEWIDLSGHYIPESGQTSITVGEFSRALTGVTTQPVGTRPIGDSSIPDAPAFTGFSTGSYQTPVANTTKAAIRAQWAIPLNTDGSTVVDGHHYEIRYRVNTTIGYVTSWDTLASYSWDDLGTWDALISDPVEDAPEWLTCYIGWGTNAFTIQELTPGVIYELQIRGVDTASPPNNGAWSDSEFVQTTGDLIAPSTPASPVVAGSRIAVQVIHHLGKASGGTFNLESDLHHLDVHYGGSNSFYPDASNKLGELLADISMIQGEMPALGTFAVEQIDQIHIKVVAVDRAGNRSTASESSTVTAELIDDAHISNLTVSKVTAGTISAQWLLAGQIQTALVGNRIELRNEGFRAFNQYGAKVIDIDNGADPKLSFYQGTDLSNGTIYSNPPLQVGKVDGKWGMKVQDLFGSELVRVGQLVAGSTASQDYGIAAVNPAGETVKLSDIAFGPSASKDVDEGTRTANTFGDLTGSSVGPSITVTIGQTGRALVFWTAEYGYTGDWESLSTAFVSVEVSGATAIPANREYGMGFTINFPASPNPGNALVALTQQGSAFHFFDNLNPGVNTFTMKYQNSEGSNAVRYSQREIAIFPF